MAQGGITGITSGFDSAEIVQKLVELNRRPIDLIVAKRSIDQRKLAAFQELKSRLQTFRSVISTMNTESRFLSTKGTFINDNASATSEVVEIVTTSQATSGTFSFEITQLARETKLVSEGFNSINSTVTTGTLRITVGGQITEVFINTSNNTVAGLRLAINNSGADVKANFLDDGTSSPIKLLIAGTRTGTENSVSMELVNLGLGIGGLALDFTETQAAQDSIFEVDGIQVTNSSNTINGVIPNSVMTLLSIGAGNITLSSDLSKIKDKIDDFVTGFNDLMEFLNQELTLNTSNNTTGLLFGNFTVQNIQATLRDIVSRKIQGVTGNLNYLSQIGIRTESDGVLIVEEGALNDALANNIFNVSQLFSSLGSTSNVAATFVGFTEQTVAGIYDLRVKNGIPQLSPTGKNNYTDTEGNGNFFGGVEGTDAEGLNFRIASNIVDGDYGTVTLAVGAAESLNRLLANLTDLSRNGALASELGTLEDTIKDFDETIIDQEERLVLFEENLRGRFTNLEILLGRLESQRQVFTQSLAGLQNLRIGK